MSGRVGYPDDTVLATWADETEGLGDGHRNITIEPTGHVDIERQWCLTMSETKEGGAGVDWTTEEWSFYGETVAECLGHAAASIEVFRRGHAAESPTIVAASIDALSWPLGAVDNDAPAFIFQTPPPAQRRVVLDGRVYELKETA